MDKKRIILQDLKNHLYQHLGNKFVSVILFGSQAKNKEHQDSDYDVLIILKSKHNWKTKSKIIDLCYDIDLMHDIIIDPHILSADEINTLRGRQPIFIHALQEGIKA
jgi:predicted nucleotidyltransferase